MHEVSFFYSIRLNSLIGLYGKLGLGGILHVFVYINKHIKPTCCPHV